MAKHSLKARKAADNCKADTSVHIDVRIENEESGFKAGTQSFGKSMWNLLLSEFNLVSRKIPVNLLANEPSDEEDTLEMLMNYIRLPMNLENFMVFGLLYFIIVFVQWLIVIPLRFILHSIKIIYGIVFARRKRGYFSSVSSLIQYKNDFICSTVIFLALLRLSTIDTSRIYHNIRAGAAIKLFFMVQLLEIGDRLLSASGQDIIKLVFSDDIFITSKNGKKHFQISLLQSLGFFGLYLVMCVYLWFHSYLVVYQIMSLNVAINSYSNTLLTMMLSNQFSELKSAVFKKTEREGLFQIACSDLNERFLLLIMLVTISSRNLFQVCANSTSIHDLFKNIKPNSWYSNLTTSKTIDDWFGLLLGPSVVVIGSEILVDWLKHAYLVRFNRINPKIYNKFSSIMASDFIADFKINSFEINNSSYPNILVKRTGFPVFAIIVAFYRLTLFPWIGYIWHRVSMTASPWLYGLLFLLMTILLIASLIFVRLILSLVLLKWSRKLANNKSSMKLQDDYIKGIPNPQQSDISDVREKLYESNEVVPPNLQQKREKRLAKHSDSNLDNVVRFEMADKRIW